MTALLAALITVTAISTAWSFWTAGAAAGANGAAAATAVDQGATPTASVLEQSVTVDWAASTLTAGQAVDGYVVKRYDATTGAPQSILSDCAGTVTTTTCTETSVPAGTWTYSVTPVFATNWQGAESPESNEVVVLPPDTTPPTNALSLSDVTGDAVLIGDTVFYRGAAPGSFTLTNALTDADSGPASSATAALGGTTTGWAHTPSTVSAPSGGPYVSNVFQWDAGTTSSPSEVVTGRDVADNTATTMLSFVNDSSAPSAGTITYNNGYTPGRFVTVTFTAGTDDGSGIATRRLQRAEATLTGGTCETFGTFTNLGPADPTSPYTDSAVVSGNCYRYQYVVTDQLGNQHVTTSASTAKVDYAGAVSATTGLLSHWRLGESIISHDTMTDSAKLLTAHTGETGATWTHLAGGSNAVISNNNRARKNGTGYTWDYTSAIPPTPDYALEADLYRVANLNGDYVGLIARLDAATSSFYVGEYWRPYDQFSISKFTNGVWAGYVASAPNQPVPAIGSTTALRLEVSGGATTTLKLYVNGSLLLTGTDTTSPLTAAGRVGIMDGDPAATTLSKNDFRGMHIDNFRVTPSAADSKGSNPGDYRNAPTLGAAGALVGDPDTAATFDGVDDYVQAVGTTGIPTGAGLRSVEAWFKTSSSARQVLFSYGTPAASQEFGLWLDAGGASMTAWGHGSGNDKTFTLPSAVNDGAWHHVVKTYDGTSLTLYVDGVALPSQTAIRNTVIDAYGFGIGAVITPGDSGSGGYFTGSIDEVSFYTSVLSPATVTNHYELGTMPSVDTSGPTGGSVAATGLVGTGSRYSTSTSLSIALDAGTDPAGVAASGAELRRATATLDSAGGTADGVCGTFGTYTLVATDPVSPQSDTVTDQACYRYRYIVADTLGNTTTYTSSEIKVDTTAPGAPTLGFSAFSNTYWSGSGSTVYYRPTAGSGGFTATASATDGASGVASYTFPALGTNWTSTPGDLGVNTYSWSGSPAAPGTVGVSATNNATLTSSTGPFTLTEDTTAPTAGSVSYPDTTQTNTTVSVSFTTGTDSGSGVGTRLLQRSTAPLSGTTCGTFDSFATVTGGTNPTSPHTDTVTGGTCYRYQYVVADNVGNQHVASSSNVVKVESSTTYSDSVLATSGLLNYYRLGDTALSSDTFTGTAGATLQSRSGEVGATWTKHPSSTGDLVLTDAGRARKNGTNSGAVYYSSAVPPSADYTVAADVHVRSWVADDTAGVVGRLDPSNSAGTYYVVRREGQWGEWVLYARVNGSLSWLGSYSESLSAGSTVSVELEMIGSAIKVRLNGVQRISVTNTAITAAGRGGVVSGFPSSGTPTVTDTTGMHLDNFLVTPPRVLDSKGTNHGTFFGPLLGVTGALNGDTNTAAQFDGVDDYASVARQISDDFSIEFWFKSTQGIGTDSRWTQAAPLVDSNISGTNNDFGVALRSDGRVVAGVGGGANGDTSIVSSSSGHNDGNWHHVVFTRVRSTGVFVLYVDGANVGTATNNTSALTAQSLLTFGRAASGGTNFYAGTLDEIAIYNTVLAPATITAHYDAR